MTGGLFAILDDIAMLLDDAAVMTKLAAKKTAGVLGDDLAVNAEKASGFQASRELPVLWAIAKGSLVNKIIILPIAFLLSAFAPWLIVPILLLGGTYLSFEGAEKVWEWIFPHKHEERKEHQQEVRQASPENILDVEKKKIKSAIITDFILSIEIIVIALGTVMDKPFVMQLIVVSAVAMLATLGVYGLVALLVRMDDTGLWIIEKSEQAQGAMKGFLNWFGHFLVAALPKVIKALAVIGTVAMLLVGGGMFVHNLEFVHHWFEHWPIVAAELLCGLVVGAVVFALVEGIGGLLHKAAKDSDAG